VLGDGDGPNWASPNAELADRLRGHYKTAK
jgi:hypothetical protein